MKHNSTRSLIARLTTALLFGTAWTVAAIDFTPPKIPDSLKNTQKSVETAAAASSNPCQRWDVSGHWVIQQANGINENVSLQQSSWQQQSAHLTGTAAVGVTAKHGGVSTMPDYAGVVSGNITGNAFTLLIERDSRTSTSGPSTAQYRFTGKIGAFGKIEGTTKQGIRWVGSRAMTCADQPASSGTPPEPVTTAPTSQSAPKISASSRVVSIPDGQSKGTVTLTWDGGPDHPYAEVWVQVDGGDEKFVIEQGKGTRTVTVERGKNYLYILTDAGRQLATAAVSSKQ